MTKRLLLTTAVGLILGTAAFAQTSTEPSKTDINKPAVQQTDKNGKPLSRVEKWQADKQTEAAEKTLDKNGTPSASTPAQPAANAQAPAAAPSSANAQSQPPANSAASANNAQAQPSNAATKTAPAQAQANTPGNTSTNSQAQTNSAAPQAQPNASQPNAAPAQAQAPDATPSVNQQAQQPQNTTTPAANTNAATNTNAPAQTTISAGVSVTDPQRTRISESVAKVNAQPLTKVNFSVSVGTVVPRDVRLHPVPVEVVEIAPQYRDYRFFTVRDEIVIVEPSTMKIVTVLPRNGGATASTTTSKKTSSTTTQRKTISDNDRATIKKHAAQPRRERTTTTTTERDDPRSARAESRRELRIGDRLPDSVEMYDMPERAYREAPALREYRYINRGSRTYVIEPRERTIIEELD